ncbi:hypothetical protein EFNM313_1488 [Enterococcus faecalis]|nr:hypothetical protein EFNM313_1488 [Enterococcus faecalis]OSH42268.1 hypothetical protein YM116_1158 [Enterococcus faecalis]
MYYTTKSFSFKPFSKPVYYYFFLVKTQTTRTFHFSAVF